MEQKNKRKLAWAGIAFGLFIMLGTLYIASNITNDDLIQACNQHWISQLEEKGSMDWLIPRPDDDFAAHNFSLGVTNASEG